MHPIVVQRPSERLDNMILTDDFSQRRWAVLAVQGEAHAATLRVASTGRSTLCHIADPQRVWREQCA